MELRTETGPRSLKCGVVRASSDGRAPPFECEAFVGAKLLLYRVGKAWVFYI